MSASTNAPACHAMPTKANFDRECRMLQRLLTILGMYSRELGIDTDSGDAGLLEWLTAATLFGTRIGSTIACDAFRLLKAHSITVATAPDTPWEEIVHLLDDAHYVRYDFRTATRLQAIGLMLREKYSGRLPALLRNAETPEEGVALLDGLPGWGPVTVRIFLRELRGRLHCADIPYDNRAAWMADHLGLSQRSGQYLHAYAEQLGWDVRDLEARLVRGALAHRLVRNCPGGDACVVLP